MEQIMEAFRPPLRSPSRYPNLLFTVKGPGIPYGLTEALDMTLKKMQCLGDTSAKIAIM